jgi:predicted transcriptional regulator
MKNTDPPDSNHKIPKFTPELTRFVESMGVYFETQGIPRIGGRIMALLLLAHKPLSAEDIASNLKVSRGSISTNVRLLISTGIVQKVSIPGDRTVYFVFSEEAWERHTLSALQTITGFRKIFEQGLTALPPGDPSRNDLNRGIEWVDLISKIWQTALTEWRSRQQLQTGGL